MRILVQSWTRWDRRCCFDRGQTCWKWSRRAGKVDPAWWPCRCPSSSRSASSTGKPFGAPIGRERCPCLGPTPRTARPRFCWTFGCTDFFRDEFFFFLIFLYIYIWDIKFLILGFQFLEQFCGIDLFLCNYGKTHSCFFSVLFLFFILFFSFKFCFKY